MEGGSKVIELMIAKFARLSQWFVIVEYIFEIALFEAIQPPVYRLFVPAVLHFNLGR